MESCYFCVGSIRAIADSPSNLEKSRSEEIVAEAKRIIDARLHETRRGKLALFLHACQSRTALPQCQIGCAVPDGVNVEVLSRPCFWREADQDACRRLKRVATKPGCRQFAVTLSQG